MKTENANGINQQNVFENYTSKLHLHFWGNNDLRLHFLTEVNSDTDEMTHLHWSRAQISCIWCVILVRPVLVTRVVPPCLQHIPGCTIVIGAAMGYLREPRDQPSTRGSWAAGPASAWWSYPLWGRQRRCCPLDDQGGTDVELHEPCNRKKTGISITWYPQCCGCSFH